MIRIAALATLIILADRPGDEAGLIPYPLDVPKGKRLLNGMAHRPRAAPNTHSLPLPFPETGRVHFPGHPPGSEFAGLSPQIFQSFIFRRFPDYDLRSSSEPIIGPPCIAARIAT